MPSSIYRRRYKRRTSSNTPSAVTIVKVRLKKPVGKLIKEKYALRTSDGLFWDGGARKMAESAQPQAWNVRFLADPHFWNSKKLAANAWKKYEMERHCGAEVPDLTMVEFEVRPVEKSTIPATDTEPTYSEIIAMRAKRFCDCNMSVLINRVLRKCDGDPNRIGEFRYAIKRKAGTKTVMDEKFPQSMSNLNYTVFNRENDVVMARLILGSKMVGYYDLEPFFDHTTRRSGFVENQMS